MSKKVIFHFKKGRGCLSEKEHLVENIRYLNTAGRNPDAEKFYLNFVSPIAVNYKTQEPAVSNPPSSFCAIKFEHSSAVGNAFFMIREHLTCLRAARILSNYRVHYS